MYASSTAAKIYEQILFKDNNLLLFTVESLVLIMVRYSVQSSCMVLLWIWELFAKR